MKIVEIVCLAAVSGGFFCADAAPDPKRPVFRRLFYGTQYYRAPTPLPDEWEGDLSALGDLNLDTIQLRINWRNNERQEDVYTFDDIDRLMDLAEKYGKKVVIKFLLECAPQYVFDRYGGTRIGPKGEKLRGGSHGAFYSGGWLPCFTNPKVRARAAKFVRTVARRYAGRKSLVLWNAWNEPRNKPIEECFCDECRKAFGEHLRRNFGTVEKLNEFYGVCEESFETIALPIMAHGYWDVFEFKLFKSGDCIRENLQMVYDAVREFDKSRPVVSHVGCTAAFQWGLGDVCNDFEACKAVDGWGTSLPILTSMATPEERLDYGQLNDFLRCVDPNYFIYEIYPGLGMFKYGYDTEWDMDYKLYSALACGAKGLNFWQYRAERVGHEADCAGLARMNGSPRPVLNSVREFGGLIREFDEKIVGFHPPRAEVAIVFDFKSLLMSEIEDGCGPDFTFCGNDMLYYYQFAHSGFYRLLRQNDLAVDYVDVNHLEKLAGYKVAYFPHCSMMPPTAGADIERFVANGGVVIADEGFAMRQPNTWMNPYGLVCGGLMKAQLLERRRGMRKLMVSGEAFETAGYHSEYRVLDAKVRSSFADGRPSIQEVSHGKGRTCLLGFSLGYSSKKSKTGNWFKLFESLIGDVGLKKYRYARFSEGLEERRLIGNGEQFVFLINSSDSEKRIRVEENILGAYAAGNVSNGMATVPARSCMILLCELEH